MVIVKKFQIKLFISILMLCFLLITAYSQDMREKKLENNSERMRIENYYFTGLNKYDSYSFIFIYGNNGYYHLFDTYLSMDEVKEKRYFGSIPVRSHAEKISTELAEKNMPLEDFIQEYLVKQKDDKFYTLKEIPKKELFYSGDKLGPLLFAAQYNYDFLILVENGAVQFYLPKDYPKIPR